MRVLISAASRHESTTELARIISGVLREGDVDVDVRDPEDVRRLDEFDAVILGSAVYLGHWLQSAREFADRHHTALLRLPVWLFSVGPVGDPLRPTGGPEKLPELLRMTGAQEHRLFPGRIDRAHLGLAERLIVGAIGVRDGDYRDPEEVRDWARKILRDLDGGGEQGI